MAITQAMCSSFRAELMLAVHDFRATAGDTFKIALYTSSAALDANTTGYTTTGEATGTAYVAGGETLTRLGVTTTNTSINAGTGFTDFDDITWSVSSITARGALVYNSTPSANDNAGAVLVNPSCVVLDFGADKTSTAGNFTIIFPAAAASTAIIRIS